MNKITLFLLLSVLISCQANNLSTASKESEDKSKTTNLSLLDRLRSLPGLRISGVGRNAQVYLRGQTSINNYREVLFYVNGNRVGNYSSAYQFVLPENIKSIKVLKSASELSLYGGEGRDGVILIKTLN